MRLPTCKTYDKELTANDVDDKCIICGGNCAEDKPWLESQTPSSNA